MELLAVWRYNKPKTQNQKPKNIGTTLPKKAVCVLDVIGALAVWIQQQNKTKEILPSLRTLTNEAERTLDLPTRRSHQGTSPWLST